MPGERLRRRLAVRRRRRRHRGALLRRRSRTLDVVRRAFRLSASAVGVTLGTAAGRHRGRRRVGRVGDTGAARGPHVHGREERAVASGVDRVDRVRVASSRRSARSASRWAPRSSRRVGGCDTRRSRRRPTSSDDGLHASTTAVVVVATCVKPPAESRRLCVQTSRRRYGHRRLLRAILRFVERNDSERVLCPHCRAGHRVLGLVEPVTVALLGPSRRRSRRHQRRPCEGSHTTVTVTGWRSSLAGSRVSSVTEDPVGGATRGPTRNASEHKGEQRNGGKHRALGGGGGHSPRVLGRLALGYLDPRSG